MRSAEVGVDLCSELHRQGYRLDLAVARVNIDTRLLQSLIGRELEEVKRVSHSYYGRLDLMERESWSIVGEIRGDCFQYAVSGVFDV
jgi:hypothetical protein